MKLKSFFSSIVLPLSIVNVYAHGPNGDGFTPGINPLEYFIHGHYIYGLLIIGLWVLVIWGIYTLTMMVIGRHIK